MSTIERLGRNLQFSFYLKVAATLSHLFLIPFILNRVDSSLYGVNALLVSIVGYFFYLDFGFNSGLSRYTAKFRGEERDTDLVHLFNLGLRIFLTIGLVAMASLLVLAFFFTGIFNIEEHLHTQSRTLIYVYSFSSFFHILNVAFRSMLNGIQREDIIHKVDLIIALVNIPLAVVVLTQFKSYLLYIVLLQVLTVLVSSLNIYHVFKLLPHLKITFKRISRKFYGEVLSFSGYYFLAGICGLIIFQVDNLVIGAFLNFSAVTAYSIASVRTAVRMLIKK